MHTLISGLKQKIEQQNTHSSVPQPSSPIGLSNTQHPVAIAQPISSETTRQSSLQSGGGFWQWITTDWPLKLGAFLVLLGFGWFVSYAFAQNWIGPMGRISLGYLLGSLVLVGGFFRAKQHSQQGTILLAFGAAIILITTYAAREVYDFFTPLTALMLMSGATAFVSYSSITDRVSSRALLALLVGCIAPFLTVSASPSVTSLFLYLFVLIAAAIWVVAITGWKELLVAGTGVYALFSSAYIFSSLITEADKPLMIVIVSAFVIMFYGVGYISGLKSKQATLADIFVKTLSVLIFIGWVHVLIAPEWRSLVMVLASILTAVAAWVLQTQSINKWLVVLHGSIALVYLTVAASYSLEGVTVLLAYIALTTVAAWLSGHITRNFTVGQFFGAPYLYIFLLAMTQLNSYRILWSEISVFGVLALVVSALGWYWYEHRDEAEYDPPSKELTTTYLYTGLFLTVYLVWISLEKALMSAEIAHGVSLVIYTVSGVFLYGYGVLHRYLKIQFAGGVLVGLVIARLLLVEIWSMELTTRIIVFTLVGLLLMAVAFLRPSVEKAK
ncbi:DUF2339 domain-containing protein [Candidatus Woesebacteria bacterium]|nr:DUF2339 domain-containing protein [Candidatus Woesebacteria bacterium]